MHCDNCRQKVIWQFVSSCGDSGTQMLRAEIGDTNGGSRYFCNNDIRHSVNGIERKVMRNA